MDQQTPQAIIVDTPAGQHSAAEASASPAAPPDASPSPSPSGEKPISKTQQMAASFEQKVSPSASPSSSPLPSPRGGKRDSKTQQMAASFEQGQPSRVKTNKTQVFTKDGLASGADAAYGSDLGLISGKIEWIQFKELLSKPAVEAATIISDQARILAAGETDLRETHLWRLAGEFGRASVEQRVAFTRNIVSGFGELSPDRRADAVRLGIYAARGAGLTEAGSTEDSDKEGLGGTHIGEQARRLAEEARFAELSQEDMGRFAEVVKEEGAQMMDLQQLVELTGELDEKDREALTDILVEAHVVPENRRAEFTEAVKPGGYADTIASALKWIAIAVSCAWVALAIPLMEVFIWMTLGRRPCGNYFNTWLLLDALISFSIVGLGYLAAHLLKPAYAKLVEQPMQSAQAWQDVFQDGFLSGRSQLNAEEHGVDGTSFQLACAASGFAAAMLILGLFWALFGVLELVAGMLSFCLGLGFFMAFLFIAIRLSIPVGIAYIVYNVYSTGSIQSQSGETKGYGTCGGEKV